MGLIQRSIYPPPFLEKVLGKTRSVTIKDQSDIRGTQHTQENPDKIPGLILYRASETWDSAEVRKSTVKQSTGSARSKARAKPFL